MSCKRMEERIVPYVDGRVKESERREMEAHLAECAACRLRVNEFRGVTGLLDELPQIEPSAAFDARVHARVAAEPAKQSWWAWFTPTVWIGTHTNSNQPAIAQDDIPVLENYDVLSNFEPLTELPQPVQADEAEQQNQQM
jgi:anti-sigma factor RsiW